MSKTVFKIENVSKQYRLGAIGGATLKGDLQSLFAKIRGKEDPNSKIGSKRYIKNEKFMALDGVSIDIQQGDTLGIIGHNGSGKSTLLKLLSRVTAPTSGTIKINGRVASMLEVGTGFHPELTGRENVYLNGAILGMTKDEITRKFDEIVSFAEMEQFIDTPVKRYSSGMYVKLAFAVAAHLDSEILIMDEVLAVGDVKFQQKCLGKMGDVADRDGRTVLYVSHNMNTIRQLCNRCVVLQHGRKIYDGNVEEAIKLYLGNNSEMRPFNDYTNTKREFEPYMDNRMRVQCVKYVDKNDCIFIEGSKILLNVKWKNLKKIDSMSMRFGVRNMNDIPVATSVIYDIYSGNAGEEKEMTFSFDISQLMCGKYRTYYSFFYVNDFGTNQDYDYIEGLNFEIKPSITKKAIEWDTLSWGNILLPPPDFE